MRWMDMGPYGVCNVGLVRSSRDWAATCRAYRLECPWPTDVAKTTYFDCEPPIILVSFHRLGGIERHEAIGYCVHEAVHVWQYICEYIKAGPVRSREIEAYSVQWISGWLIKELKL